MHTLMAMRISTSCSIMTLYIITYRKMIITFSEKIRALTLDELEFLKEMRSEVSDFCENHGAVRTVSTHNSC